MSQGKTSARLLRGASIAVFALSCAGWAGTASAQTASTANTDTNPIILDDGPGTITVPSDINAILVWQYSTTAYGTPPNTAYIDQKYTNTLDASNAKTINVAAGGSLTVAGYQSLYSGATPYFSITNLIQDQGDLNVEGNGLTADNFQATLTNNGGAPNFGLLGNNTVGGNLNIEAGATVDVGGIYQGGGYSASTLTLGAASNVSLGLNTTGYEANPFEGAILYLYTGSNPATVINGSLTATAASEVWLNSGALTVNGTNTTAANGQFLGTLKLSTGTTFTVGDSSHPDAVFGDPVNNSTMVNVARDNNGAVTLKGYGTIDGTVTNDGVVMPGGTSGAFGTLTVNQYVQNSTGILSIEISPTGADQLKVVNNAQLDGTLSLTVDPGSYGDKVIPIISAGSISGSFASVQTVGNEAVGLSISPTGYDVVTEEASSLQVFGHLAQADRTHIEDFVATLYDQSMGEGARSDFGHGNSIWLSPFGHKFDIQSEGIDYSTRAYGLNGGVQHTFGNNAVVGVAGSYGNEKLKTDAGATSASTDTYDVALYGGFNFTNAKVEGSLFYNHYDADVIRSVGESGTIGSSPSGHAYGGSVQLSHVFYGGRVIQVAPYVRGTYARIDQAALTETGDNLLALKVNKIDQGYMVGELGTKFNFNLGSGARAIATTAVDYNFSHIKGESVTGQFANLSSNPFDFDWSGDNSTAVVVGLEVASSVARPLQLFGKISGRVSEDAEAGQLEAGLRYRF